MKKLFLIVGIALFAGTQMAAIAYAIPAAWAAHYLAKATNERVQLADVSGVWHNGGGVLLLSSAHGGTDAAHWAQRAEWNFSYQGWPVVGLLRVSLPEIGPPFLVRFKLGWAGWEAELPTWQGTMPLSALAGLGAPFNTLALDGDARIRLSAAQLSQPYGANDGAKMAGTIPVQADISRLRSAMSQGVVLGDYKVQGAVGFEGGEIALSTQQGRLLLDGKGQCKLVQRLTCDFLGHGRAAQDDDALVSNLLGLLGKQQGQPGTKNLITELRW